MNASDIVEGFRKVVQDLLVPELKAVQTELKHLNEKYSLLDKRIDQVDKRIDLLQQEMNKRFDAMQGEIKEVQVEIKEMQREMNTMIVIQQKILDKMDVDKRMIRLETLVEQLQSSINLRKAS